ncbi:accessory Sec system protein Asp1 [Limosilactobacillus sp. RRLNB_1_1]|uniref:Accessory Sec system protein Asp1 n=1 Tax=Limosilactobacillus albertensis TaxID=2759752 RepID=A0A7W3Y8N4_9LACO|nr:accessory Sec system protein Asp1 [Limosilactobacillus albertensis]MBB1070210.1 accessory Sec system protein Asp1 [Limosilactobacillus albertensis]MCD7119193.1 accessory Sec system protein Asp1 [Limosilactobacillus albertensis]MCD7129401.1 accessory Sec system protein Asp1 [Limosilactobacillus albertensis]
MNYLVPAWHRLLDDWSWTIPRIEFDDAVSHIKVFQESQVPYSLVITDYQPQLSTKLNQLTVSPSEILNVFDYLQGIDHLDNQIVTYHDFTWPADAYFDFTSFRIIVIVKGRLYAKITFDTQGKILWVDYFVNDKRTRRLLLDSRGFVSREELFDDHDQPIQHIYYDEQGYWRIKHNLSTDRVEVNDLFSSLTKQLHYDHLSELIVEVVQDHLLSRFNLDEDNLIVTLDGQAQIDPTKYLQYQPLFSLSHWHPYQQSLAKINAKSGDRLKLLADNEETHAVIKQQTGIDAPIIPLFQSRFNLGHSQRLSQERIGLFIENMTDEEVHQVVELIYQRLVKKPAAEALTILTYSVEKMQLAQKCINQLKDKHQGEFILASEAPDEVEEILTKQTEIPKLAIDAQRITTPAEIGRQFDSLRIIIDWGTTLDEFLQITAISTGIPQLCRQPNRRVKDYKNGIICSTIPDINHGLDYFIGNLKHWNQSLVYDVQLMNQYSAAELMTKWQPLLKK